MYRLTIHKDKTILENFFHLKVFILSYVSTSSNHLKTSRDTAYT